MYVFLFKYSWVPHTEGIISCSLYGKSFSCSGHAGWRMEKGEQDLCNVADRLDGLRLGRMALLALEPTESWTTCTVLTVCLVPVTRMTVPVWWTCRLFWILSASALLLSSLLIMVFPYACLSIYSIKRGNQNLRFNSLQFQNMLASVINKEKLPYPHLVRLPGTPKLGLVCSTTPFPRPISTEANQTWSWSF